MPHRSGPARPGTGLTEDGRPRTEVTSYARRGSRLTAQQQAAWDRRVDQWLIPASVADQPPLDLPRWFGREAPLVVEIGSGVGEAVTALAARRPADDVLAVEVWRPGIASTLAALEDAGVGNVRLLGLDAVWVLEHLVRPGALAELWTFFPDPWPKQRHHKRRLVDSGLAALVAERLAPGARWRLATDWPTYAAQIADVLAGESRLRGGVVPRWEERPVTRFERRGLAEGRVVTDFCVERV